MSISKQSFDNSNNESELSSCVYQTELPTKAARAIGN